MLRRVSSEGCVDGGGIHVVSGGSELDVGDFDGVESSFVEGFYAFGGVDVRNLFPAVVRRRETFPSHEVLVGFASPVASFPEYGFDFPLFLAIYEVWRWFFEVRAMRWRFAIRRQ